jgi:hypothetical protein
MIQAMSRQEYLADLRARNRRNRQVVETTFVPLNQAQRSWQPEPHEWSVDQCFQHLVIAFEWLSPNFIPALDEPEPPDADGIFRPSWLARRFMEKQFDPQSNYKTRKENNPAAVYSPEILTRWLDQQARLADMIEQATQADLQTKCWVIKWMPLRYNLGDYLNFYVSHDELHIDQARRVSAAYGRREAVSTATVMA